MKSLVIIPAYNESKRLPGFLTELDSFNSDGRFGHITIKIIDDGSYAEELMAVKIVSSKYSKQRKKP